MANSGKAIVQQIRLDGGATIKTQLEAIGAAGKKAFTDLQNAVASNRAFGSVGAAIDAVKARAAELGSAGRKLANDWGTVQERFRSTSTAIAVAAGATSLLVVGLTQVVTGVGETIDKLQNAADALGITTREFENMAVAAQGAGIGPEALTKSLNTLNRSLGESQTKALEFQKRQSNLAKDQSAETTALSIRFARLSASQRDAAAETAAFTDLQTKQVQAQRKLRESNDEEIDAFKRLEIETHNADGSLRNILDVRDDIADAFKDMADGVEKSSLAMQLFGSRNTKVLTFFNQGSKAIRALETEAERIAPALTKMQIEIGDKAGDAFGVLQSSVASAANAIRVTFAPDALRVFEALTEMIVRNRTAFILLAADIERKVRPIVDDFIALIEGRDQDVKNTIVLKVRDAIVEFGVATQKAVTNVILPALAGLLKVLDIVAKAINGVFGTNLSGSEIAVALVITKMIGLFGLLASAVKLAISAIGLLATALGGPVALAIAALAFAVGFTLVRALQNVDWTGLAKRAQAAWDAITGAVAAVRDAIVGAFNTSVQFVVNAWNGVVAFFGTIAQAIGNVFNNAAIAVSNAFNTAVQFITNIWNGVVAFFAGLPATIGAFFVQVGDAIVSAFANAVNTVKGFIDDLWNKIASVFNAVIDRARAVATAISAAFGSGGGNGAAGTQGFAGGGYVRGPGTSRSDSIVARLSDREYVVNARATAHYGVSFLNALNSLRLPIDMLRGFSLGGFVDAITPRLSHGMMGYADGGLVAASGRGGRSLHLHIPGVGSAGPFFGDDAVVNALHRKIIRARLTRASKGPSWVGAV